MFGYELERAHGGFATIWGWDYAAGGGGWTLYPALRTGVPGDFVSLPAPDVPAGPMNLKRSVGEIAE